MQARGVNISRVLSAWGSILRGSKPVLSIEITRECPLRCPGCYAYEPGHLGDNGPLRQLSDFKGEALIDRVLGLVERFRPTYISIVGGEPLVRYRELDILLPKLDSMGIDVQLVTSAVRPIPLAWRELRALHLVVSVDGLAPEHDRRRAPATYERILKHIAGHRLIVHCTVTRHFLKRPGYLRDFTAFWSERQEARKIWFSLYTPQEGDTSEERLSAEDRIRVVQALAQLRSDFRKVDISDGVLETYLHPPRSPDQCIFAQATACVSADLATGITPCQFGGRPVCTECGCMASASFASMGRVKIAGVVPVRSLHAVSQKLGEQVAKGKRALNALAPEL